MVRVEVRGELLRWARDRAGLAVADLVSRFPQLERWEIGEVKPTLKQLEAFAAATRAPLGFLFLPAPPHEEIPIPDFRTLAGQPVGQISPDLREMIEACQRWQDWYVEHAQSVGADPLPFVGSATLQSPPTEIAARIRDAIGFGLEARSKCSTWEEALRLFADRADHAGILVMRSGIVMSNTHRKLDPREFRGFALVDRLAPLVFINGADSKSAQMFSLAHELAHVWLGTSALSGTTVALESQNETETWCNRVAAELLVPIHVVRAALEDVPNDVLIRRLSLRFKVSTLVILQRLRDAGRFTPVTFRTAYDAEIERLRAVVKTKSSGGDFYATSIARYGRRFASALVGSALEGRTLYRDAMRLLGATKSDTVNALGRELALGR